MHGRPWGARGRAWGVRGASAGKGCVEEGWSLTSWPTSTSTRRASLGTSRRRATPCTVKSVKATVRPPAEPPGADEQRQRGRRTRRRNALNEDGGSRQFFFAHMQCNFECENNVKADRLCGSRGNCAGAPPPPPPPPPLYFPCVDAAVNLALAVCPPPVPAATALRGSVARGERPPPRSREQEGGEVGGERERERERKG